MTPAPHRTGSFDTMRLTAALMVFHSHAFALSGHRQPLLPGSLTFGAVAVSVFFVMSGYLVTTSALRRSTLSYIIARAIRVWPGLAVCCAVSIVMGAFVTSLPTSDYLSRSDTFSYMRNTFVFWTEMQAELPGVFEGRPYTAVNGSLWTLRYEVLCYVVLGCVAVLGRKALFATAVMTGAFSIAVLFGHPRQQGITLLDYLELKWIALLGTAFVFGSLLNWMDRNKLPRMIAVSAFAMWLAHRDPILRQIIGIFLYGSTAVWLSLKLNLDQRITRGTDLSYGIYIYAFPCQQIAAELFYAGTTGSFVIAYAGSLVATTLFAILSWFLVEKPALKYKDRLSSLATMTTPLAVRKAPSGDHES